MPSLVAGEPLRILLVSPRAELRAEVGDALQAVGEHRYYWVSQPDLALTRAQGLAPHVILVDEDLGDVDPAGVVERLAGGPTGSVVIFLAAPDALEAAQVAVFAGARAFVVKPVKGDDLLGTLRQVLGQRIAAPQPVVYEGTAGRVIVFCASKGGTGRTTMAINTAVCLRENLREPVVVVDADYAAPAIDVALNLKGQRDIRDLLPKLNQLDSDLLSSVLAAHSSGVRVLLAPPPETLDYPPTLPQVQQVTAWLRRIFPWVLVDLGLPLDEAAYAFLDAADRVVMSVLPEAVSMRNTLTMLGQFDARHYPPGKVWPVLNREGLPGGLKRPDVAGFLRRELRFAIPNDQDFATETINRGVPMVIAHRRRPVAQAYRKLATALAEDRKAEAAELASHPSPAPSPAVEARSAPSRQGPIPVLPETFSVIGAPDAPEEEAAPPDVSAPPEEEAPPDVPAAPEEVAPPDVPAAPEEEAPVPAWTPPPIMPEAFATPTAPLEEVVPPDVPVTPEEEAPVPDWLQPPVMSEAFVAPFASDDASAAVSDPVAAAAALDADSAPEDRLSPAPPSEAVTRFIPSGDDSQWDLPRKGPATPRTRRVVLVVAFLLLLIALLTYVLGRTISGMTAGSGAMPYPASQSRLAIVSPMATATGSPVPVSLPISAAVTSALPVAVATRMTLTATARPSATVTAAPTRTTAPALPAAPTQSAIATPTRSATATPTQSATATAAPTRTTAPTRTAIPTWTVAPANTATASRTIAPANTTAPARTAAPRATARPPTRPAATAIAPAVFVSAPALREPARGQSVAGVVTFRWFPTGPLPPGASYEVVWWNSDEPAASARGIAAPTSGYALQADLDYLVRSGQLRGSRLLWTVLVVQTNPYVRLTTPGRSELGELLYSSPGG